MIGQSSNNTDEQQQQQLKRRALEDLCDEVCGHQHIRQPPNKRPRLADLQLLEHDLAGLQYEGFDTTHHYNHHWHEPTDHHHHHHHHKEAEAAPVARLEVLVVDGTWDEALESFEAAATAGQTCNGVAPLTELTSQPLQPQHDPLQNCAFPDAFWTQNQQQQQQQQEQQTTVMPRLSSPHHHHHHQVENVRPRMVNGFNGPTTTTTYEDQENGNLSWLLDFKLDSLIEAPEERNNAAMVPRDLQGTKTKFNGTSSNNNNYATNRPPANNSNTTYNPYDSSSRKSYESSASSYGTLTDNRNARPTGPKKPPFTYTELIEHALQERGELTVSAIYQWISEHFPYYKSNDDRWKNSVRHNLSINPHFRKGSKAPHGAGHLWAIASQDEGKRQFFNIASIRQALQKEEAMKNSAHNAVIDEVAAATASIAQPPEEENIVDSITLEHCAEQILSGIKREVEVQYLVPMMVSGNGEVVQNQQNQQNGQTDPLCPLKETDFLNPVSKEVVAEECGLIGEGYLVTDLNPTSLGLNMAESEVVTTDNLFGEELSFQFYEFATASSQLQSA